MNRRQRARPAALLLAVLAAALSRPAEPRPPTASSPGSTTASPPSTTTSPASRTRMRRERDVPEDPAEREQFMSELARERDAGPVRGAPDPVAGRPARHHRHRRTRSPSRSTACARPNGLEDERAVHAPRWPSAGITPELLRDPVRAADALPAGDRARGLLRDQARGRGPAPLLQATTSRSSAQPEQVKLREVVVLDDTGASPGRRHRPPTPWWPSSRPASRSRKRSRRSPRAP